MSDTLLDYISIFIVIWFTPHSLMFLGVDVKNSYWESYKLSGIISLCLVLTASFFALVVYSFWRLLGWV